MRKQVATTQKERLATAALTAFDAAAPNLDRLLTVTEERNLNSCRSKFGELADQMGVLWKPLGEWQPAEFMQFATAIVRCAVPLGTPDDLSTLREFDDEIPF